MRLAHLLIVALLIASFATASAGAPPSPAPAPAPARVHFDPHGNVVVEPGTIAKPAGPLDRVVEATDATSPLDRVTVATESRSSMQLAGVIAATEAKRGHSALDAVAEATIAHINTITSVGGTIAGGLAVATCSVGSGFLGVAACSAIGAVVGTSVQIALDGLIRWVFPSKPSLTIEEVAKATDTANAPCPTDGFVEFFYACTGNSAGAICWPDPKKDGARRGNVTNFFVLDVRKMPMDVIA
ncbi:hypothetical protein NX868_30580, partial [Burkholderia thailandensis]|nr:hypothetical protein [Burkholderia thailandensis]MCS6429218.1 hypothetical protein [Burkholderia thailandensis]MCS6456890.1 hypothetical protein [Burkholderia thailandensis]MCS6468218.1 hypothetical protein [Burkholderia thailandensis]MCS6486605.1 hypothetical protein [Burkholderia thailandensis]